MKYLVVFLVAFGITFILMPIVIYFARKLKLRQTILSYVDKHISKSGTPTMGGIAFILGIAITIFLLAPDRNSYIVAVVMLGYGVVGFLDDFLKVYNHRNEGLKPYQKIVFQLLIAGIVSFSAFRNSQTISIIFREVDLGYFVIPFNIFLFLAFTNSVNLTDGLDGLAASVTMVSMLFFAALLSSSLALCAVAVAGGVASFLLFNVYPAKIFMGDTGSLALGGAIAAIAVLSGQSVASAMFGIMFVVSAVSVIIQVAFYKKTKRRVFLMAPFHHHLEKKGVHENRIVAIYTSITAVVSIITLLLSNI